MRIYQLDIYRPGTPDTLVASVEIGESTVFEKEFMGMDRVVARFVVDTPIDIAIDDYITYQGDRYSIKDVPGATRNGNGYAYEVIFYSPLFAWYDVLIMHLGSSEFSYTGTPFEFATLLLDNIQPFDSAWQLGDISLIDEPVTLTFSNQSCYVSLFQVADAFGLEFVRDGKFINLVERVGTDLPVTVEYGRGKGLYELVRKNVDGLFATEWYGFGGTQNLPIGYRSGMGRLGLDSPVQRNIALYGRKQGAVSFEHIFPRYEGTVTSTSSPNEITDTEIDFDIEPIADGSAKIVFKTGPLGGNEFTITGWDQGTGKVTFGVNREESGYVLPNDTVHAEVGDKYTIIGVVMDPSYVATAEAELLSATEEHADANSHPKAAYELRIDDKYIRDMGLEGGINPGDSLGVRDSQLGLDGQLKIQNVSWPLVNPGNITASIAEVLLYTYQEKIAKDSRTAVKEASNAQKGAIYARRVSDEIANAVILNQFERTYIGDRAVLTGVFVAGNPDDGDVAGISGVGSDPTDIRFWGGASYDNRASAPFRVNQAGQLWSTAGYIGGFAILPNSLESAQEYNGGKFVLYPNNGFIAFLNPSESVWSGIGENVMPTGFAGSAVGRFENTKTDTLANYGLVVRAANSQTTNIAMDATGSVKVNGALTTTNLYKFTPTSSINGLSFISANTAWVLVDNATYSTVYLPSINNIEVTLGIGSSADFAVKYTVVAHYNSLDFMLASAYDMRDSNGNIVSYTEMASGDQTAWYIIRESGNVVAQIMNRQWE